MWNSAVFLKALAYLATIISKEAQHPIVKGQRPQLPKGWKGWAPPPARVLVLWAAVLASGAATRFIMLCCRNAQHRDDKGRNAPRGSSEGTCSCEHGLSQLSGHVPWTGKWPH